MQDGSKLRVLVSMSREVFGIVDPYTALRSDECVFDPCLDGLDPQDTVRFNSAEQVLVIPQPCYTFTRIRVLKLVRKKGEYEKLKDCIVLPSQTEAPVVANKYFVCWDEKLMLQPDSSLIEKAEKVFSGISSQISRLPVFPCFCSPEAARDKVGETAISEKDVEADSPSTASKLHESGSFQDELKKYFSTFKSSDDLISKAKSHFEEFASLHGPSCFRMQETRGVFVSGV
ncbi:hypothetical protein OS493_000823 [Desmophyllum pertusum]|uniref:RNA-dependent RNA polymerase n=1 Tax=Desmophyllum pertusum TaxID=174260 RepID=A0A9X0D6J0_9CNID|nr:hypothetical protein OS493_000823 [Desmophyllum pertusum]